MYKNISNQKNTSLIIEVLKEKEKIRRSDLYKEVMKKHKQKYGKSSTYQVVNRDVSRLLENKIIRVIEGGQRSQILSLK